MRKGRSSRRSRVSRPLVGVKSSPGDVLSTDAESLAPPRVVVGVPPSDPPPPEDVGADANSRVAIMDGLSPATPSASSVSEPKAGEEKTTLFASTLAFGSPVEEPIKAPKQDLAQTLAFGSSGASEDLPEEPARLDKTLKLETRPRLEPPQKETQPIVVEPRSEAVKSEATESEATESEATESEATESEASKSEVSKPEASKPEASKPEASASKSSKKSKQDKKHKKEERDQKSASAKAQAPHESHDHHHDHDHHESIAERFFSDADVSRHLLSHAAAEAHEDALTVLDKVQRKSHPVVVERRQRLGRYVKWAVAVAAVVCLAAVIRTTMSSSTSPPTPTAEPVIKPTEPLPPTVAAPTPAPSAVASAEPTPSTSASAEPAASASTATSAEPASPAPSASAEASPGPSNAEPVTGDAKEEKTKARTFLERRKIAEAIEAGQRSVALDPTDGEAWLILGAAYQEKGNMVEARKAYASCVKEGKTGPRQECAKMLR